jgi:hypothetical protein
MFCSSLHAYKEEMGEEEEFDDDDDDDDALFSTVGSCTRASGNRGGVSVAQTEHAIPAAARDIGLNSFALYS